jgi:hypothetical protein
MITSTLMFISQIILSIFAGMLMYSHFTS